MRFLAVIATLVLGATPCHAQSKASTDPDRLKFVGDTDHSSIEFRTEHWGILDIIGWFEDFDLMVIAEYGEGSPRIHHHSRAIALGTTHAQ